VTERATAADGDYQTFDLPVAGGVLRVGRWGRGPRVVLAAHGLTASHVWFRILAGQLSEEFSLVAPDLRGRGASHQISGPFSVGQHAEDLTAVLEHLGLHAEVAVGHSMGAWAAVLLATSAPDLVGRLVLIDGGLPKPVTPVGPILERLALTFQSVEEYLGRWRSHPALAATWNDYLAEAYAYDLEGDPPQLRARVRGDAISADQASVSAGSLIADALVRLSQRADLALAPRGIFDEPASLYSQETVTCWTSRTPGLRAWLVPDVNHYTILTSPAGSRFVAWLVRGHSEGEHLPPGRADPPSSGLAEDAVPQDCRRRIR
jgi:lipase